MSHYLGQSRLRRRCAPMLLTAVLVLFLGSANAAKPMFEEDVTDAGAILVTNATHGRLEKAFRSADELRNPHDAAFAGVLEHARDELGQRIKALGSPGRVSLIQESHFGGCVESEYRVAYSGGEQLWFIKFRHGTDGWQLADLVVRNT